MPSFKPQKLALITGASSGIGYATALHMAQKGYRVIGTSRSMARLEGLGREAAANRLPVTAVELDINSAQAVDDEMPRLLEEHGPVDVLVNNAGYSLWGPMQTLTEEELKAVFETNYFAAFRLIKHVLPGMIERRSGHIINMSSIVGRMGTPFNGAYVSTKWALEGMSESLRTEVWPFGVRVSVVEPGLYRTNFFTSQVRGTASEDKASPYHPYVARFDARHKTYNVFGKDPAQVAKVVHRIARSRRPAFRYPVGIESTFGTFGKKVVPERLFQWALSRFTLR
ncbi:MAG: SDR family oxidoreductase [SAR202 cluster bacterium]|nr:SDR family oxidoreductase [SAR202 cluster bacterium]